MLQNYKKTKEGQKGFTIVELLIVIVVIAILAAITIVAYNGVTTSARSSKAKQNAQNVQSVAEAYNAQIGSYPGTISALTTGGGSNGTSVKIPSGLTVLQGPAAPTGAQAGASIWTNATFSGLSPTALTAANGETTVTYSIAGTTGGVIAYWDFAASSPLNFIYVGAATSSTAILQPGA